MKKVTIIAGPCAVESEEQIVRIAIKLKQIGVDYLIGGVFKPRTNPDSFQGLGDLGIEYLLKAKEIIVTELMTIEQVRKYADKIDIIQIGSRNMYNYELLKELSHYSKPVLLKRGLSATYNEWINAAKYINNEEKVILCERGIRTFETKTRNTLDISCIPIIKLETNLPIIVDLSHSLGRKDIVYPIAKAVIAVGGDGIMIEVHPDPNSALSDNEQQMNVSEFKEFMDKFEHGF